MKKLLMILLALTLVMCLCACNKTAEAPAVSATAYTFPEGTAVAGIDLSGLTPDAGWTAFQEGVSGHTMTITVDGVEIPVTAEQIGLTCSQERYEAIAAALEAGAPVDYAGLISFNEGKLRALVNNNFNKPVTEAAIVYDEEAGDYVLIPDSVGQISNPNELVSLLKDSILNLETATTLNGVSQLVDPTICDEDADVIAALEQVKKMNAVELTYSFTAEDKTSTMTIPAETIRSLITLGADNVTPGINRSALELYVAELSETYSAGSTQGNFIATGGGTVGLTVSYNGVYLDQDAMADDISKCILEGTSGKRTAPFQASGIRNMPYGGTYIEVNLSAQKLWFYKHGECIYSTSFVSGKVSSGWITPNGVFSMYAKEANVYLEGDDYRTFVNYWMPFYGGYGLHDATWRGSFGGDIYLYNGSHGCVNLPVSAAAYLFNNASVGTRVIVYGGRTSVPAQPQSLSGTTYYDVASDASSFNLDIRPRYTGPTMTYTSSNTSVASVSSSGAVTINGVGSTTITVSVPSYQGYTAATISVTVNVHSPCDEGRHSLGTPTTIKAATCQPGLESVSCGKCDYSTEREIAAVESHSYGTWTQVQAPTCGAAGKEEQTCTKCLTAKETREIPATGAHVEGEGVITTNPGCETTGVKSYKCTGCDMVMRTEEVAATGHSHSWQTTTSPSCTGEGVESYKCSCGSVTETRPIAATGHSYSGGTCSKCGTADPNYVAPEPSEG